MTNGDAQQEPATAPADGSSLSESDRAEIAALGYEQARDELATIVSSLESGSATLEESMRLWERGEALAAHCRQQLEGAQQRIDALTQDVAPETAEE